MDLILILFGITAYIIFTYTYNKLKNQTDAIVFTSMFLFGMYSYKDRFNVLLEEKINLLMLLAVVYYFIKNTSKEGFETVPSTNALLNSFKDFLQNTYDKYLNVNPDNRDIANLRINNYDTTSSLLANMDGLSPEYKIYPPTSEHFNNLDTEELTMIENILQE